MLFEFAKKIQLPDSPLDEIIDKLGGPGNVAEMTGRKGRIARPSQSESPRYETRTPDTDAYGALDSLNVQEVRVLIFDGLRACSFQHGMKNCPNLHFTCSSHGMVKKKTRKINTRLQNIQPACIQNRSLKMTGNVEVSNSV